MPIRPTLYFTVKFFLSIFLNRNLGYNLYAAALKIIQENASLAIKTNDRKLLDKCFEEDIRVMQNKNEAKNINELMLEKFNQENNPLR